jgi:preprotein translocase subunit YajC
MSTLAAVLLQSGGSAVSPILLMGGMLVIFYFLLVLPGQRKQKKWQQMLGQLKPGDKVTTSGGIVGVIFSVKAEGNESGPVVLRVAPDNIKLEVSRNSIVSVKTDDEKS